MIKYNVNILTLTPLDHLGEECDPCRGERGRLQWVGKTPRCHHAEVITITIAIIVIVIVIIIITIIIIVIIIIAIIIVITITIIRNVLGTMNLGEILSQRESIAREMQVILESSDDDDDDDDENGDDDDI